MFINDLFNDKNKTLNEVSNELLGRYKKAAGADASAADKRGDTEQGNKRFKGIVKATIKQGENDVKKHKTQGVAEGFSDIVKGVKRKVAGKADPKEVEKDYAVKARREIGDANRYNNPAAYADSDKAVRRYNKVAKVVNKEGVAEGISVVDQDYDLDQIILTLDIEGKKVSFTYWNYDENFANAERKDVFDQLQKQPWYARLDHPTRMEILDAAYRAIRGLEPQEYRPTVGDEPLDEQGVAEGSETHKYQVVVKGHKRSYSVWVEAKNEDVAIIRAQQYVAREHSDKAKHAAVVDMKQGVAEGSGPKEKQKTPYRDINSPEYRAAADKQKQRMAKDKAAEPGKKMLAKQGVAEGSLNEFAPDGFNGGDDREEFNPRMAKMAYDEGVVKGASLADGATLERAMAINDWDKHDGGIYKQHFAKGFKKGRLDKINFNNKQYNLNLKLMKDGSIRHGEQGVAEGKADPVGSWVVYDGSKVKRFKSRDGAKAYAEKNGGKVASSEFYADKIQKQGVAEGGILDDLLDAPGKVLRTAQDAARGIPPGTVPDSQDDLVNTATKIGKQVIDTATDAARGMPTGTVPKSQKDKDVKEQTGMQYNPKGVPIKSAQATPAPLNVPQGWEAKTQADGSTRISKQGSMSSAEYKQNMADYKAKNWTPEKMADYGQRMASGQGYTDAEKSANYQQQQQHFGQYADKPLDEQGRGFRGVGGARSREDDEGHSRGGNSQAKEYNAAQAEKLAKARKDSLAALTAAHKKKQGVAESTKCNMTEEGRACPNHGIMECPGYSRLMGEAFKMPPESLQDRMYRQHQELRKKRGAPDPSHYKELAKKKQQEIDALRAEIEADKAKGLKEDRYLEELQRAGYEVIAEKKVTQRLDPKCWKGKHKEGTKIKGGVRVNNCVPNK